MGDRRKYDDLRKLYSGITAGLLSISTAGSGQGLMYWHIGIRASGLSEQLIEVPRGAHNCKLESNLVC